MFYSLYVALFAFASAACLHPDQQYSDVRRTRFRFDLVLLRTFLVRVRSLTREDFFVVVVGCWMAWHGMESVEQPFIFFKRRYEADLNDPLLLLA